MPATWKLVAAALPIALLAACGSGGSTEAKAPRATTTTVDAAAAKAELTGRLLTAADLATGDALDAGWEAGDPSKGVDIKLPDCVQEATATGAATGTETKMVSKTDLHLPSLQEDLSSFGSDAAAAQELEKAAQRLDACDPTFVFQGTPTTGQIQPLPFSVTGATAKAWRTTVTIAGTPVAITNVHVAKGATELSLIHVDLGTPDITTLQGLADKALAKLP